VSALVDWDLAARLAARAAGDGPAAMDGGHDLAAIDAGSRESVLSYTGLEPVEPVPAGEWVSRREWARINLDATRALLAPLEGRIAETMPAGAAGRALAGVSGRVLAIQVGGLLGLASRRVLGQYEYPLLGGEGRPRLLFVGQNIDAASTELAARPADVLSWVSLHEVTHAVHFSSSPWLRGHLGGLVETLLAETPPQLSLGGTLQGARRLVSGDPRRLLAELRASDPVTLLAPAASRPSIESVQATMAIVEGYAEHVMDAAGTELGPVVAELRAGLERRRENRGTLARILSWLLGFEMKLRQYRDGKRFADEVVAEDGISGLNRAWDGPRSLPNLAELADPATWLDRVSAPAEA
jgi:coenzyme F420 biosynthesis associated uncharacterized protein